MNAEEIRYVCKDILGDDWEDYFYEEFICAVTPGESAYYIMAELKRDGWTVEELANHEIYGYWANLCGYHPLFQELHKFFSNDYGVYEGVIPANATEIPWTYANNNKSRP